MAKAEIIVSPQASHSIEMVNRHNSGRIAADQFSHGLKRQKNYSALLSDLWTLSEQLLEAIALSDEPLPKKVAMLKDAAKLLPLLDRAEQKHRVHIKRRAVEDMDDRELARAVQAIARAERRG